MAADKPTIVFIHGAFHGPECFNDVVTLLQSDGFPTVGVSLPTAGKILTGTAEDDVKTILESTQKLADEGKDIVLVMHSYGGFPGTESAKGLIKKDRLAQGKQGGIIALVYIAAALPAEGKYVYDALDDGPPDWIKLEDNVILVPDSPKDIFYHDVPDAKAEEAIRALVNHSAGIYSVPSTYAAYKHAKAVYLFCEQDKALPPPQQRAYLSSAGDEFFSVHSFNTSHSPFMSTPQPVSELIQKTALEAQ